MKRFLYANVASWYCLDTTLPLCNVASTLHCICCHYLLYIVHVEFMFIFDLIQQRIYPEGEYRGYFTFDIDVILKLDTRHWDLYLMLFDVDIILLHFITSQFSSREICVICCPRVVVYSDSYKFMVKSKPMILSFRVSSPLEIGHNITRNSLVFAWTNLFCNPLAPNGPLNEEWKIYVIIFPFSGILCFRQQRSRRVVRRNFVVSAITFEGFKLRSSNLTHALFIKISRTSSITDILTLLVNNARWPILNIEKRDHAWIPHNFSLPCIIVIHARWKNPEHALLTILHGTSAPPGEWGA